MAELRDILGYLCRRYPHRNELSKARLTKLVYLADWKAAIDHRRQLSAIKWRFNHFGPYVDDILKTALDDPHFNVASDRTMFGNPKDVISLKHPFTETSLGAGDIAILDHVIEQTRKLNFDGFIQLVYSTYPVLTGERGATLNLVEAASRYALASAAQVFDRN